MIPDSIKREHVLEALQEIGEATIPFHRQSADYDVLHAGKRYPPKYVIGIAARLATGSELAPDKFHAGTETNTFLSKLGFEIVRRPSAPVLGAEADVASARAMFEKLVPDEATRKLCATIFADAITQAHAAGEARWEISLRRDLVRLNGGRVLVFDVRAEDVFVAVDPAELGPESLAALENVGERSEGFALLPQMQLYRVPQDALIDLWPQIQPAFRKFVGEAVLTARRCVWARLHAPAVVDYLSQLLGRDLPQPVYGSATESEDEQRGTYWANQEKGCEEELAGGYLFAPEGDAAGATPGDSARLKQLVPGDVVVHYATGVIQAVSRVVDAAVEAKRPGGDEHGWVVNVEVFRLATPVEVAKKLAAVAAELEGEHGPLDKSGEVKPGYLWTFSEAGLATLRAGSTESWPAWTNVRRPRFWMFHANPDQYDVRAAVKARSEIFWSTRQHKSEIRVGDTVFLWEAGAVGGIVAQARVLTEPAPEPPDPAEDPFRKSGPTGESEPSVRLKIERVLDPLILGEDLRADPAFIDLAVFVSPQRTNSAITNAQGALLSLWIDGKRPPRIVKIALGGDGEFWDECLAGGYACVGWDEVGDLRQFSDWPSFRKAFGATCEVGKPKGHVSVKAQELWTLARLRPGDRIVANRGLSWILGVGTVKEPGYLWDATRKLFRHTVAVDWDTSNAGAIPPVKYWGMITVGKVPPNIIALVLPELASRDVGAPVAAQAKASLSIPPNTSPFVSLLQSLASKDSKLWFAEEVVAHYVLGLQAKRFVILTGVSGTGKTQLALAVAKHFQPRSRRIKYEEPPADATLLRVKPYMAKYRRFVVPAAIASGLSLGGLSGSGTASIEVEYPGGKSLLSCHREVRSSANSVHYLNFKPEFTEWFKAHLAADDEFFLEHLEPSNAGHDRLRLTVPTKKEEVVVVKNYEVVAVRPDWTDGRGLLGFYNPLTRRYMTTPFLRLLLEANDEARRAALEKRAPSPFFIILDEMNLARVEQYFSDFLSAIESGESLVLHDDPQVESGEVEGEDDEDVGIVPRRVQVPPNLFFTGTVNVDETTYMFSPKVLDRAFVIEFNEVDLDGYGMRDADEEEAEGCALRLVSWGGLDAWRAVSATDWDALALLGKGETRAAIVELNDILAHDNRHFGYRVANEMARFLVLAARHCLDPEQGTRDALDLAILSKVLPKLHGTQQELEDTLLRLFAFLVGKGAPSAYDAWNADGGELTVTGDTGSEPKYPRSGLKVWRMLRRLRAQGFTSFIE